MALPQLRQLGVKAPASRTLRPAAEPRPLGGGLELQQHHLGGARGRRVARGNEARALAKRGLTQAGLLRRREQPTKHRRNLLREPSQIRLDEADGPGVERGGGHAGRREQHARHRHLAIEATLEVEPSPHIGIEGVLHYSLALGQLVREVERVELTPERRSGELTTTATRTLLECRNVSNRKPAQEAGAQKLLKACLRAVGAQLGRKLGRELRKLRGRALQLRLELRLELRQLALRRLVGHQKFTCRRAAVEQSARSQQVIFRLRDYLKVTRHATRVQVSTCPFTRKNAVAIERGVNRTRSPAA